MLVKHTLGGVPIDWIGVHEMNVWVRELTFCAGVVAFDAGLLMHGFDRWCWGSCCGVQHGALVRRMSSGRKFRRCRASVD
jgi:hypothetical protein